VAGVTSFNATAARRWIFGIVVALADKWIFMLRSPLLTRPQVTPSPLGHATMTQS